MKRRILVGVAVAAFALMLAAAASGAVESSDDVITRESTGVDIASNEAVVLANSAEFAEARAVWADDAAFLDQVDYQVQFRQQNDFMDRDPEHIASAVAARSQSELSRSMGLSMTPAEEAEMLRRDAVGNAFPEIVNAITGVDETRVPEGEEPRYGNLFGGIAMDQHDGGAVMLAVTDASAIDQHKIESMLDGVSKLRIIEQRYSYDEQATFRDALVTAVGGLYEANVSIKWEEKGRAIVVESHDVVTTSRKAAQADVPKDAYVVVSGDPLTKAGAPNTTHSWADQQPGLRTYFGTNYGVGACTWGFNGHTNTYNYIVSAGHCPPSQYENFVGTITGQLVVAQNGNSNRVLASQGAYLYSINNDDFDGLRMSSSYADDNCYHGNFVYGNGAHCMWPMKHRALYMSWEVNVDRTCASLGNSGTYRCGYITEEYHGGNNVAAGIPGIGGDSGSGMKWDYRIDGVLTDISGQSVYFENAYIVQSRLSFQFNCASTHTVHANPSNWGNCPSVNA